MPFKPTKVKVDVIKSEEPNLLTEGDLIGLMEEYSIGTPGTYPIHINTLLKRNYITIWDGYLK